jgi:adenosine deaminase
MLNCFEIFLPLVRRNLSLLEQLAFDFCQRQWEQNTIYTEVRYSPHLLAESYERDASVTVDPEAVFHAVTRGTF